MKEGVERLGCDASGISILTSNKELYGGKLFYCYGNNRESFHTQPSPGTRCLHNVELIIIFFRQAFILF